MSWLSEYQNRQQKLDNIHNVSSTKYNQGHSFCVLELDPKLSELCNCSEYSPNGLL